MATALAVRREIAGGVDIRPDPPIRRDGFCACGCGREVKPERWQRYAKDVEDAFASTECCRAWHGAPIPVGLKGRFGPGAAGVRPTGSLTHGTREGYRLCACNLCRAAVQPKTEEVLS